MPVKVVYISNCHIVLQFDFSYAHCYGLLRLYHRCKESGPVLLMRHSMHVKDRYANGSFIDKLTKWYQ